MTQPRRILGFAAFAAGLLLLPTRAAAQSGTVTDDGFLSTNATTQLVNLNGQGIVLVVAGSSAMVNNSNVGATKTYIKFQLTSSLPPGTAAANVVKATLKLYLSPLTKPSGAIDIYPLTSAWTESTLNPSSPPALASTAFAPQVPVGQANSFLVVDVTKLVQEWLMGSANGGLDNDGIALVADTSTTYVVFDSKESIVTSHEPRLEIVLANSGQQGPAGPQGPQGAAGPAGTAATVTVGQTTTGLLGTKAMVTNAGNSSAALLNFLIPQGPTGLTGAQGLPGQQGIQGIPGLTGQTGATGAQGPAGISNRGNWLSGNSYSPSDAVSYNNSFWMATVADNGSQPPSGNPNWQLLAAGINNRGNWSASNNYNANDAVSDGSSYWLALAATSASNATPNTSCEPAFPPSPCAANWQQLAAQGAQGSQGPAGAQGPQGIQGTIGLIGPQGPLGPMPTGAAITTTSNTFTGNQTINGNLVLGTGGGITFADGTTQTTSGTTGVPSGSVILGNSSTPPAGYTSAGILGGTGQWYSAPALPIFGFSGAAALNGQLYAVGGIPKSCDPSLPICQKTPFYTWDTVGGSWTALADLPQGLLSEVAAGGANGKIFTLGGNDQFGKPTNGLFEYDPVSNKWQLISNLTPEYGASAVVTQGGASPQGPINSIWFIGGYNGTNVVQTQVLDTVSLGIGVGGASVGRYSVAAAQLNGLIYILGGLAPGVSGGCALASKSAEVFDTTNGGKSMFIADLPVATVGAAAAALNGKIYLLGGEQCPAAPGIVPPPVVTNSVYVYDPATDTWSTAPSMPTARAGLGAVVSNGKIFAIGSGGGTSDTVVEQYAPPVYMFRKN
jgi:N-acetylneuraminic acid mutarotase